MYISHRRVSKPDVSNAKSFVRANISQLVRAVLKKKRVPVDGKKLSRFEFAAVRTSRLLRSSCQFPCLHRSLSRNAKSNA